MSTYLNPVSGISLNIADLDAPDYLMDFLNYQLAVCNLAPRTVNSYYIQIRLYLRWLKLRDSRAKTMNGIENVSVSDVPLALVIQATQSDIIAFISYNATERENGPNVRKLKLAAIRKFYNWLVDVQGVIDVNPASKIVSPKLPKKLPKYLSYAECLQLLQAAKGYGEMPDRDYCMITLLLNCGMRLSELVSINVSSIRDDQIRIIGKGNKERMLYLNDACIRALKKYMEGERAMIPGADKEPALFISRRTGKRITARRVEQTVEDALQRAGLGGMGYSPHKLRHTAATLMHESGADMKVLSEILGHESIATTDIYTHLSQNEIRDATRNSPLARVSPEMLIDK